MLEDTFKIKERNILILVIAFVLQAFSDMLLTNHALQLGFYETNKFTQLTNPTIHFGLLISIVALGALYAMEYKQHKLMTIILLIMNIIWAMNNVYSLGIL